MDELEENRALIVEDEPSIRNVCRRVLSDEGFEVDTADNGKSAQELVRKQQYALLLADIRLPVMSGIELYDWLQKEYPQLSKNTVFMTGSVMGGETMTFLERSGQPYMLKPFRPDELIEKIREARKEA